MVQKQKDMNKTQRPFNFVVPTNQKLNGHEKKLY
jgi:hypothetical protein